MSKTVVVWSCAHADPKVSNERFEWVGKFLFDLKPDMVIDLGDGADMRSLNTYDERYPKAHSEQNYQRDIQSYLDSQEKLRWPFRRAKKGKPFWVGFEGNHEYRIKKALGHNPRLEGQEYGLSFSHLQTDYWFNEYHEYDNSGPAIADYDGVSYAHFFSSGNFGSPVSGIHHAYTLLQNRHCSSTCGHSHKRNIYFKDSAHPVPAIGLVVGCLKGHSESWAGQANRDWWHGLVVKREVSQGYYEPEFISLKQLEKEYGS